MSNRISYEKLLRCRVHREVIDESERMLDNHGCFCKADVVSELDYDAVAPSINWDFIRKRLEERIGYELIPMAQTYFEPYQPEEKDNDPGKFLAGGFGKKTAGFTKVTQINDPFVVERYRRIRSAANGTYEYLKKYVETVNPIRDVYREDKPALEIGFVETPEESKS